MPTENKNSWKEWFKQPKTIYALCIFILAYSLTLIGTCQRIKNEKLTYGFDLINQFPKYLKYEPPPINGEWVGIQYEFNNPNDYEIYYRVNWLFLPQGTPTAEQFVFNTIEKVTKKSKIQNMMSTKIGRPQIDNIKEKKDNMFLIVVIEVWDKQGNPPDPKKDKVARREIKFFNAIYPENEFIWQNIYLPPAQKGKFLEIKLPQG